MNALGEASSLSAQDAELWPGIAKALHAVFAIASKEDGKEWEAEITESLEKSQLPDELKWLRGVDTGASSCTIFFHLCDAPSTTHHWRSEAANYRAFDSMRDVPHDADDFGRCHRLLKRFPAWRERLPELAAKLPDTKWPKLVEAWDQIASDYEAGEHAKVTKRIQNL